jgi:hypothetical protein
MQLGSIMLLAVSVLSIASNAIGIQALADEDSTNKKFLIAMLVLSIIALLASGVLIYYNSRASSA